MTRSIVPCLTGTHSLHTLRNTNRLPQSFQNLLLKHDKFLRQHPHVGLSALRQCPIRGHALRDPDGRLPRSAAARPSTGLPAVGTGLAVVPGAVEGRCSRDRSPTGGFAPHICRRSRPDTYAGCLQQRSSQSSIRLSYPPPDPDARQRLPSHES